MLVADLFEEVLISPAKQGADELWVITGYSSPSIVNRQLQRLKSENIVIKIRLLIGMVSLGGLPLFAHEGFKRLQRKHSHNFTCNYLLSTATTHSKNYLWYKKGRPFLGFTGSANYSINAFSGKVVETLTADNPVEIKRLYEKLVINSIDCLSPDVLNHFNFPQASAKNGLRDYDSDDVEIGPILSPTFKTQGLRFETLSLLTNKNKVHERGGINWQQIPGRKDKDAAYIPVPTRLQGSKFFPPPGKKFSVIFDDGTKMTMVTQAAGGKQLTTPDSNQILGKYLRHRLGLQSGAKVTFHDFQKYGRSDVKIYKQSSSLYYLDFSV